MRHLRPGLLLAAATALAGTAPSATAASAPHPTSSRQVFATVRLVHGIPGVPVDVYLNGRRTVTNLHPLSVTGPLRIVSGRYLVVLRRAGSSLTSRPLVRGQATVMGNHQVSLVAHVTRQGGLGVAEYVNLLAPTPGGQARLVLVNAAAVGLVDGYLDRFAFRHLASLRRAPDRTVSAGTHTLRMVKTGTGRTLVGPKHTVLSAGYAYTGFLVGSSRTFALILQADKVGQEGVSELVVDLAMQVQVSVKIHLQVIEENQRVAVKRLHVTAVPRQRTPLWQPAATGKGRRHP